MDITHKTNIKRFLNVERTRQTDYGTQDLRNYVIVNFVSFFSSYTWKFKKMATQKCQ